MPSNKRPHPSANRVSPEHSKTTLDSFPGTFFVVHCSVEQCSANQEPFALILSQGCHAWKERLCLGKVEGDVASGVPRSVEHSHLELPKVPGVSVLEADVNARDAILVCGRPHNCGPVALLHFQVAARVIKVMVCVEDVVCFQAPAGMM